MSFRAPCSFADYNTHPGFLPACMPSNATNGAALPIRRALLSVSDKTGLVDLARALAARNVELLSTGGTAKAIRDAGLPVRDVSEATGFPEMMDGRVKTLHPVVHGGLLGRAGIDDAVMAQHGIAPIDLLVLNLYPFERVSANPDSTMDEIVENIDIGGPAMLRSAAKNYTRVAVATDPAQYAGILEEFHANDGALSATTRFALSVAAFDRVAQYDACISNVLSSLQDDGTRAPFSGQANGSFAKVMDLRYGENPHQRAAFYRDLHPAPGSLATFTQLQGKELSYNNIADSDAAWECVRQFDAPACVIVKHANPCGVAVAGDIATAYTRANECDPVSAFGGIVAVNGEVSVEMAEALAPVFTEVVVAPGYADGAIDVLTARKNLRVLTATSPAPLPFDVRPIDGGLLVQQPDPITVDRSSWTVPTRTQPTDQQWDDLAFAWVVCAAVSSNAIVYCHSAGGSGDTRVQQAFGIGAGQQNRVDSARIAARRSDGRAAGGVCASDAYFPFRDGFDVVAEAGITAVIQPGGSIRDDEVIAAADEHGIAMVMTGERHFRH